MSEKRQLDLALRVLDQQIVDWGGRKCGKVDDILIDGEPGKPARVRALAVGPGAALPRRPRLFGRWFKPAFGSAYEVEVPWSAVAAITHVVKLEEDAEALGLYDGEVRAARLLGRIPGS